MAKLKDIAAATNLTQATVSRVLRNRGQWSLQTRARVWQAARELKYRPNLLVRGIQTGRTQTVGVMLPMSHEFSGRIFNGLHDALIAQDYVPILLWCHDRLAPASQAGETKPAELAQIHRLIDRRVDGLILRPVEDAVSDEYLRAVWEQNLPLITVDRELERTHADFVGSDDLGIGRTAAEYLMRLGHRRLGHVAGPDSVTTARLRREGFETAAAEAGARVVTVSDRTFGSMADVAVPLLQRRDRPSAVFAANDVLAFGVLDAARRLGLVVPRDLSVVGCGNLYAGGLVDPPLTTFDQHAEAIGARAVAMLNARLSHPDLSPQRTRLSAALIERKSAAPPCQRRRRCG